ncbi:hypothetical protein HYDPIDRAFT_168765 [Hydnomerulius pinastri MD-312]|uniref:Uncharacterized protein n=1 Tax=Hydnomerulius pinastri MD-312 TaxID=994086 RepID=A0A0C9VAT0_9AGAM|nr:hypothetical protein HYDPIDRAFT_168765 [Hydnomerulius pinastri MD-312]
MQRSVSHVTTKQKSIISEVCVQADLKDQDLLPTCMKSEEVDLSPSRARSCRPQDGGGSQALLSRASEEASEREPSSFDISELYPLPPPFDPSRKLARFKRNTSPDRSFPNKDVPDDKYSATKDDERTLLNTPSPLTPSKRKLTSPIRASKRALLIFNGTNSQSPRRKSRLVEVPVAYLEELVNARWDAEEAKCRAQRQLQTLQMQMQIQDVVFQ